VTHPDGFLSAFTVSNPLVIAEISSNHNQDLERSKALVRAAAEAGANAVKFQLFELEKLFAPEVLEASPQHRSRKRWELPRNFVEPLAAEAHALGMSFGCTPFDIEAANFLEPHVDFFKISSYELLWHDLLAVCGSSGKPVILSTGMANESEVASGFTRLRDSGCSDIALLHCVSAYPAPRGETNLRAIRALRERFKVPTGWSDHSHDSSVVRRAVHRWGASILELHFDLEGEGFEAGSGHCWLPHELTALTQELRADSELDGNGVKQPTESELSDVSWRADPSDGLRPLLELRSTLNL
jgi:N-acetylneuraminate synthase